MVVQIQGSKMTTDHGDSYFMLHVKDDVKTISLLYYSNTKCKLFLQLNTITNILVANLRCTMASIYFKGELCFPHGALLKAPL